MVGPAFAGINAEKTIDLTQLSVNGYDAEEGDEGTVFFQFLTAAGRTDGTSYTWLDMPGDFDAGWYDDDFEAVEAGSVTIKAGDGMWTNGAEDFTVNFAGEVVTKGAALPLPPLSAPSVHHSQYTESSRLHSAPAEANPLLYFGPYVSILYLF